MKRIVRISAGLAIACSLFASAASASAGVRRRLRCLPQRGRNERIGAELQGRLRAQVRHRQWLHVQRGDAQVRRHVG